MWCTCLGLETSSNCHICADESVCLYIHKICCCHFCLYCMYCSLWAIKEQISCICKQSWPLKLILILILNQPGYHITRILEKKFEFIYLYHCRTDMRTSPICSTPLMKPVGLWCLASSAEQTDSFLQLEKREWWRRRGASHRRRWWCSLTSCRRSQKWRRRLERTANKLEKRERRGTINRKWSTLEIPSRCSCRERMDTWRHNARSGSCRHQRH